MLTTRNIITNKPEVLAPMNYNTAIAEANRYLQAGENRRALEAFKDAISGEKITMNDLLNAAGQEIRSELVLS
ncbi:MAG: hypothetical protein ACKOE6_00055 [Flammeovirgaceae bacterium]